MSLLHSFHRLVYFIKRIEGDHSIKGELPLAIQFNELGDKQIWDGIASEDPLNRPAVHDQVHIQTDLRARWHNPGQSANPEAGQDIHGLPKDLGVPDTL